MIAVDTNVILRYLLKDHPNQFNRAKKIILGNPEVLLTDVVLAETVWTLEGRRYGLDRPSIAAAVRSLFDEPSICFEHRWAVWRAVHAYREFTAPPGGSRKSEVGFADALIAFKAAGVAANRGEVLSTIYTFDKAAQQLPLAQSP